MSSGKPWKSFEEQLAILKGHGLQVDDMRCWLETAVRGGLN